MRPLLALCCAVVFIDAAFFAALAPILPSLKRELGLSELAAGVLSGSYGAGVLVFALPGGWFAARQGAKAAVLAGLAGMAVFSPMFGFARELIVLDVARFMQGASGALMWAGAMSWVITAGPVARRGALVGTLVAAATVGELLGAPIGALAHKLGTELVFGAVGAISLVLLVLTTWLPAPASSGQAGHAQLLATIRSTALLPAALLLGAISCAFGAAVVLGPLRLDALGGSAALIAAAFALGSVVETILGPQVGRLSDRVGRARPYIAGALLGACAIVAMSTLDSRALVFSAIVLFAFAAGLGFTPSLAMAADEASDAGLDQGYASGLTNVAFGGGQMLGALGAGLLAGSGYVLAGAVVAMILLLAATAGWRQSWSLPQDDR